VPPGGVPSTTPTMAELLENQDFRQPKDFDSRKVEAMIEKWKRDAK
jgi:hypothetical protein